MFIIEDNSLLWVAGTSEKRGDEVLDVRNDSERYFPLNDELLCEKVKHSQDVKFIWFIAESKNDEVVQQSQS